MACLILCCFKLVYQSLLQTWIQSSRLNRMSHLNAKRKCVCCNYTHPSRFIKIRKKHSKDAGRFHSYRDNSRRSYREIRAGHLNPMATIKYSLSSPSSNVDYIHIIIIIFASLRVWKLEWTPSKLNSDTPSWK